MKAQQFLFPVATLLISASAMAESDLRSDCDARVRAAVAAASVDVQGQEDALDLKLDQAALDAVQITNVKVNSEGEDVRAHVLYSARVKTDSLKGTVRVTATRGGCFLNSLNLHE